MITQFSYLIFNTIDLYLMVLELFLYSRLTVAHQLIWAPKNGLS